MRNTVKQQLTSVQPLEQVTRNLVRSLLNSKSLYDKFIFAKSAILSKNLRGYEIKQRYVRPLRVKEKFGNVGVERMEVLIGNQDLGLEDPAFYLENQPKACYLKKTQLTHTYTQTEFKELQKDNQICQYPQFQQVISKVSLDTQDSHNNYQYQQSFDSCCSFLNEQTPTPDFTRKKAKEDESERSQQQPINEQTTTLKAQILDLKSQIQKIDQQKNKWKKKALKYSSKIQAVENEQQRFEKQYKKTIKKQ